MSGKIAIGGDFYVSRDDIERLDDHAIWSIREVLRDVDLRILNLEAPIISKGEPAEKFGPHLQMSVNVISVIKRLEIDLLTLANNHIFDYGQAGLADTLASLDKAKVRHIGGSSSIDQMNSPAIFDLNGSKVGIINVAENEFIQVNGVGANALHFPSNLKTILELKGKTEKIIVIVHGGNETHLFPSIRFKETLRFFIDAGADAVIAHHTHCFNGYEYYKDRPIAFGLGNFLFRGETQSIDWSLGAVAVLKIKRHSPIQIEFRPFLQNFEGSVFKNVLPPAENDYFECRFRELETVISSEIELEKRFNEFIESKKDSYNHFIQPYSNIWLHRLFSKRVIPSLWKKKKKRLLLNLIRCESHRDVILKLLDHTNKYPTL